jgi:hypothetical protein
MQLSHNTLIKGGSPCVFQHSRNRPGLRQASSACRKTGLAASSSSARLSYAHYGNTSFAARRRPRASSSTCTCAAFGTECLSRRCVGRKRIVSVCKPAPHRRDFGALEGSGYRQYLAPTRACGRRHHAWYLPARLSAPRGAGNRGENGRSDQGGEPAGCMGGCIGEFCRARSGLSR